jgi:hypothetical protein
MMVQTTLLSLTSLCCQCYKFSPFACGRVSDVTGTASCGHRLSMELRVQQDERLPFLGGKPVSDMTGVEIADQLDQVTSWIEAQRVKEREARATYQQVAQQVESSVAQIRQYAQQLLDAQGRKATSFSGLLGREPQNNGVRQGGRGSRGGARAPEARARGGKMNIGDAILAIWSLPQYQEQLTTEEISDALPETGYKSNAAPTSLKSSINQALAKLCRAGQVVRYRSDGSRISARDTKSRARKYIATNLAGDED